MRAVVVFVFNGLFVPSCSQRHMRISAPWRPRLRQIVQQKSKYVWRRCGPGRMLVFGLGNLSYPKTRHRRVLFAVYLLVLMEQIPIVSPKSSLMVWLHDLTSSLGMSRVCSRTTQKRERAYPRSLQIRPSNSRLQKLVCCVSLH